jgi:cysteine-rich repeat protein
MAFSVRAARAGLAVSIGASFAGCLDWNALYGARCGDALVSAGESCDDGNLLPSDGCSALCQREGTLCGDGFTFKPEECDDANSDQDDACLLDCRAARCGDGQVWLSVENCDDGNQLGNDGCSASCQLESDRCGDRAIDSGEECDDGNRIGGDGCSASCEREPSPELCGNASRDPDEACDDGNQSNDDSCLKGCSVAACGDGFVRRGVEQCDDGNSDNNDGCTRTCLACARAIGSYFATTNGHCYTLHSEPSSFAEALALCDAAGGHIWTTTSMAEAREVNRNLVRSTLPTLIGFRVSPAPAGWITGESTNFQPWAAGEPSDPSAGCAVQIADPDAVTSWHSATCSDLHPFVCESEAALVFAATRHAYRLHTRSRSWLEARDVCANAGGYLVSVESAEEQEFLRQHFSIEVWLGATRGAGGFEWTSGAPLVFTAFGRNQPDNAGGNENCLVFNRFDAWADADCTSSKRFVCEFE